MGQYPVISIIFIENEAAVILKKQGFISLVWKVACSRIRDLNTFKAKPLNLSLLSLTLPTDPFPPLLPIKIIKDSIY